VGVAAVVSASSVVPRAFASYGKWAAGSAVVYISPANQDGVPASQVISALRAAMDDWNNQGGANFSYVYGGLVNDGATAFDNRNVVLFRNESTGNIAYTYTWWDSSNRLLDSDMMIYDPGFTYFATDGTCNSDTGYGVYLHDLATHEFGHMLGLSHSGVDTATMAMGYAACSTTQRSLDPDDIAGIQSLYGRGSSSGPTNTAPSVSISSPTANATFDSSNPVPISGTASDTQDGDLSPQLQWTSNLVGLLGTGPSVSTLLPAGSHAISATVTDSAGLTTTRTVSITVTAPGEVIAPAPAPAPTPAPTPTRTSKAKSPRRK